MSHPGTVLIVDDDADARELMSMVVEAKGLEALAAKSAVPG